MRTRRLFLFCAVALAVSLPIARATGLLERFFPPRARAAAAPPFLGEFALNTFCVITLFDQASYELYEDIFRRIREIEGRMSLFLPGSDVSRVNAAAGIAPVRVHGDVFTVIERAARIAELSGGAFDPSIGPLTALWDIMGPNPGVPSQEEINAVLPLVNWRNIDLDRERRTVFLTAPGMALDLGAIAKGFAADEALAIIRAARLDRAIINLGGDVIMHGARPDRTPWRVGLQTPHADDRTALGIISGWDMTVTTSGVYERYFVYNGARHHHLLSPFDGHPARTGILSTTIVSSGASMDADALSTAVFVLGYERGRALVDSLEGVEAIFVFEDLSVRATAGVDFTLVDGRFRLGE
ncbi:MAG: FAD:protein FMN transferase [Treponema sp.]|nr:FAD:protein FMN transferase [Treponema sp.]